MSVVELSPVVKTVDVRRSARDAFRIFTDETSAWWPMARTRARSAAGEVAVKVTIEPRVGGRVYETLQDGRELDWGKVSAFDPGVFFSMQWLLGRPAEQYTDVSVRFEPIDPQTTRVTLTHENWQRMGDEAESLRNGYNNGWVDVFENHFKAFANRQ